MIGSDVGRLAVFVALPFVAAPRRSSSWRAVAGIGNAFFRPAVLAGLPNLVRDEELADRERAAAARRVDDDRRRPDRRRRDRRRLRARPRVLGERGHVRASRRCSCSGSPAGCCRATGRSAAATGASCARGLRPSCATRGRCSACSIAWSIVMVANGGHQRRRGLPRQERLRLRRLRLRPALGAARASASSSAGCGALAARSRGPRARLRARCSSCSRSGSLGAARRAERLGRRCAMVLAGFGNGGAVVANITLVQRGAPDRVRGRVFTLLMSVNYAVLARSLRRRRPDHERRRRALGLRDRCRRLDPRRGRRRVAAAAGRGGRPA